MKNNNKWFSLPLAMWIVILITILSITILEYIIPFAKDIKWVENSSVAYYGANSWIEEWLYSIAVRTNEIAEVDIDFSWRVSNEYSTISKWTILPPILEWNSEYDNEWNTISAWNPIQLIIWKNYINAFTNSVEIYFRVPDLNDIWTNNLKLNWPLSIVNWQLSAWNDSLNALNWANWIISDSDINNFDSFELQLFEWVNLSWDNENFKDFYELNCEWSNECTLKFSIVNKLETDDLSDPILVPYLEWKIDFDANEVPLRYTKVSWWWRANWFKKLLDVKVATQTVNEAFDFTVFQ